ncbi:MAG: HAD-IC family P-type ATPase, partial [Clostridia bacterium]|nr:HAD-IC family P-type ATPase [Clostridia bacterium]
GFWVWRRRALSFRVICCPCALVVSVPLAFFAGLGGLSKAGVLVKGAEVIEKLARYGILCTDKTGTLTEGRFTVVKELCSSTGNEEDLLTLAAHAEKDATHPIAESIKEAYGKPWSLPCETIRQVSGKGVLAEADGKTVLAGTRSFLTENGVSVPEEKESGTLVYVAAEGKYLGCLVIADTVKKEAKEALSRLASLGVRRTVMLTGDRKEAARPVAEALGISEAESELLPQDKLQYVRRLLSEKKKNESLVYVGDGINDAPVLALADVGIAMGALGSDAAMEASDALLMNDSLLGLPRAVSLSRRVMRLVRENVALIIGVKAVCLILTASGVSGMFLAVFADVGVLVAAILNAVRGLFVPKALRK